MLLSNAANLILLDAKGDNCHWVTIRGNAVCIGGDAGFIPDRIKAEPGAKRFSKAQLERSLVEHHESVSGKGTVSAQDEKDLHEAAGAGDPWTFHGKLPTEVKEFRDSNPATRKLFRVTDNPKEAGGADAFAQLGDRYLDLAEAHTGSPVRAAVATAKGSQDPAMKFLADVHKNLPNGGKGMENIRSGGLQIGDKFKVAGVPHRVAEDADGYRVLKSGKDYHETPVDAIAHIPIDKGSFRSAPRVKMPKGDTVPFLRLASDAANRIMLAWSDEARAAALAARKAKYAATEKTAFHSATAAYKNSEVASKSNTPAAHQLASSGHGQAAEDHEQASTAAANAGDHDAAAFHAQIADSHRADAAAHAIAGSGKSGNPKLNAGAAKISDAANKSSSPAAHAKATESNANSASQLKGALGNSAKGISDAMYDHLVGKVSKGETDEGGKASPVLQLGKAVKERGVKVDNQKMKELGNDLDAVRKSGATGSAFQKAMNGIVEKHAAAAYHDNKAQAHSLRSSAYQIKGRRRLLSMTSNVLDCGGGTTADVRHGIWTANDSDLAALLNHRATQTGLDSDADLMADAAKYLGLDDEADEGILLSRVAGQIFLFNENHDEHGRFSESQSTDSEDAEEESEGIDTHGLEGYKPPSPSDLEGDSVHLWHGSTASGGKRIADKGIREGQRGTNASADVNHAAQYPEDTGAETMVLVNAKTKELGVDPNDQIGDTVGDGLFPSSSRKVSAEFPYGHGSSATLGSHKVVAVFDVSKTGSAGIQALQKGDWAAAERHGVSRIDKQKSLLSRAANAILLWRPDQTRDEHGRFIAEGGTPVNTAHPRLKETTKAIRRLEYARRQKISTTPEHAELTKKLNDLRGARRGEWRKVLEEEKAAVAAGKEKILAEGRAARAKLYQQHGKTAESGASNRLNPIGQHVSRLNEKPATLTSEPATAYLPNQPNASHDPFDAFNAAVEEHYTTTSNPTTPNASPLQSEAGKGMTLDPTTQNAEPVRVDPSRQFGLFAKDKAGNPAEIGEKPGQANLFDVSGPKVTAVNAPASQVVGSKAANDPANTLPMFQSDAGKATVMPTPNVQYVRAKAGGEKSDVDGKHYKGGQLMPIHGMYSGQGKPAAPPTGATKTEPAERTDKPRTPPQPLTPEQIADRKAQAEQTQKIRDVRSGPLGQMLAWHEGDRREDSMPKSDFIHLTPWRDYAASVGEEGLKPLNEKLTEMADPQKLSDWKKYDEPDMARTMIGSKSHQKNFPTSMPTHSALSAAMDGADIAKMHAIHQVLSDAQSASPKLAAMKSLQDAARPHGFIPNKYPGVSDSGKRVKAGEGFVKKNTSGKWETHHADDVREAIKPKPMLSRLSSRAAELICI